MLLSFAATHAFLALAVKSRGPPSVAMAGFDKLAAGSLAVAATKKTLLLELEYELC